MTKPIFIIGFPGSGKTTICNALKDKIGNRYEFVDLDDYITERIGMTIREFFAKNGEQAFRTLESESIKELACKNNIIIACGGGTPCFGNNMETMNNAGKTIRLVVSEERLFSRLLAGRDHRPLIAAMNPDELKYYISHTLAERSKYYSKASFSFSAENLEDEEQIEATITDFIKTFGLLS